MRIGGLLLTTVVCLVPQPTASTGSDTAAVVTTPTARIVLVGDVMLGRGVTGVVRTDPAGVFAATAGVIAAADLAGANLESPLTTRPHIAPNPNALEAPPVAVGVLAAAGFDVVSIANNHSGDAGRGSIADTISAVTDAGIAVTGGGVDLTAAHTPVVLDAAGISVAFLGYDLTGAGIPAGPDASGIAHWDEATVSDDVRAADAQADVVIVSVHGGVEYSTTPDASLVHAADVLVAAGADVMWGHHAHVRQPVIALADTVIATGLGNALFDQPGPETTTGGIVELIIDSAGVRGFRAGTIVHPDRLVRMGVWDQPRGTRVWMDGAWWAWLRDPPQPRSSENRPPGLRGVEPVAWSVGDLEQDGSPDLIAVERVSSVAASPWAESEWRPYVEGASRLGIYRLPTLGLRWLSDDLTGRVAAVVSCDTAIAVEYLDGRVTAWTWDGRSMSEGPATAVGSGVACIDLDGDLATELAVLP